MSLSYDLRDVADSTQTSITTDDGDRINPVTECLIFATIVVDMGGITEANAKEFFIRLHTYERMFGMFLMGPEADYIKAEDVIAHIGLKTNVSEQTRAKWRKRILDISLRDYGAIFENAKRKVGAAA